MPNNNDSRSKRPSRRLSKPSSSSLRGWISLSFTTALLGASLVLAANFPAIDFDLLGAVSVAGDFAGIEVWNQTGTSFSYNSTYDPNTSSLFQRSANGTLTAINATEDGGAIRAICQLQRSPNTIFIGGSFQSFGHVSVSNIASYNPQTKTIDSLNGGVDGTVLALHCDDDKQQVIVGGSFTSPHRGQGDGYMGSVASWSTASSTWSPVDFGGLKGTVNTITAGSNSSLVRFGGDFGFQFIGVGPSSSDTNTSASALTSALTPISLGQVEFVGGPSSRNAGFNNPAQILCPQGPDASGNSYLFEDGAVGRLTARAFRSLNVRAIRLGNTFVDGRGTKTFGIQSIPDNVPLQLLYLDPTTGRNVTCTNDCLLSHDPSIPFQDFLITEIPSNNAPGGVKTLTGIQFTAYDHYGSAAGLHILELLSVGGWAYAYNALNRGACNSPETGVNGTTSNADNKGGWYPSTAITGAGTTQPILVFTDDYTNLRTDLDATVTWQVDIPVNGNYTINVFVPSCSSLGQCGQRTEVNVNVFPVPNSQGFMTRVPQTNENDATVQVYSGQVSKSADGFSPTVILSIPSDAPPPSGSSQFTAVADKVTFFLLSSNETAVFGRQTGFGLLEYNLFDPAITALGARATQVLPNNTMTAVDTFSALLYANGVRGGANGSVSAVASVAGHTFVAGNFTSGINAHITGFSDDSQGKTQVSVAKGGLNGAVNGLAAVGNYLFAGGRFTATSDGSTPLRYVARYDPNSNTWASLGDGPDGPVSAVYPIGSDHVLVAGSFQTVNGTKQTGGYAVWDVSSNAWNTEPAFVLGEMTAAYSSGSTDQTSFLAGRIKVFRQQSASGAVELKAPKNLGDPPLIQQMNFQFTPTNYSTKAGRSSSGDVRRQSATLPPLVEKRSIDKENAGITSKLLGLFSRSHALQQTNDSAAPLVKRAPDDVMLPPSLASVEANEVLASTFWQRDDGSYVNILGGNFTTTTGIRNLAMYDNKASQLVAFPTLPSATLRVIRALLVDDDTLYVGGDGGFATFDLKKGTWNDNSASLASESRSQLSVTAISHRPATSSVVVAGTFDSAGSLPCMNICEWDTDGLRWSPIGAGLQGDIYALDYAGQKANQLVVAGSMILNGEQASLASYNFDTQVWSILGSVGAGAGQIPGPATAASVDDLNVNSIFAVGIHPNSTDPFFVKWDGTQYHSLDDAGQILAGSGVAQLALVPILRAHPTNAVLENNRLLVLSGTLITRDYGNISSVFFDGQNFIPFLVATKPDGSSGTVRSFSRSTEVLKFPNLHQLAVGLVILISIAIGLGIVFLLVLMGLVWALSRRRPERGVDVPVTTSDESLGVGEKKRPSSLLATLNAATENAMMGGAAAGVAIRDGYSVVADQGQGVGDYDAAGYGAATGYAAGAMSSSGHGMNDSAQITGTQDHSDEAGYSNYHSDGGVTGRSGATHYLTDEGEVSDAAAAAAAATAARAGVGMMDEDDSPMEGIPAHARYDFVPNHESELPLTAGEPIEILDDQDKHWWLARNARGQTGVVPSSYVM